MNFAWRNLLRFFKLSKWKRIGLLVFSLIAAVTGIVVGAVVYVAPSGRSGYEYSGGTEYLVQINAPNAADNATAIASDVYQRIDRLGVAGVAVTPETSGTNGLVRVVYPGTHDAAASAAFEREITFKPSLAFTDIWGNPLFTPSGNFDDYRLTNTTSGPVRPLDGLDWVNGTKVPLVPNSVTPISQASGDKLQVQLATDKLSQWTAATRYISALPEASRRILIWTNLGEFINRLQNTAGTTASTSLWDEAGKDPFKAAHINNDVAAPLRQGEGFLIGNVKDYLVANVSVTQTLNSPYWVIDDTFSLDETVNWARKLNFAIADYTLTTQGITSYPAPQGASALRAGLIAIGVIFALFAVLLIVNYGLLGALATIALALFTTITLVLFTVMRGEYSPAALAVFLLGLALAFDTAIILFERIKTEVYVTSVTKTSGLTLRRSWWQSFDAAVMLFIPGVTIFYFSTQGTLGISTTLMLTSLVGMALSILFVQACTWWLFGKRPLVLSRGWLGLHQDRDERWQKQLARVPFTKVGRYWSWFLLVIIVAGGIALAITAATSDAKEGLVLSSQFKPNYVYQFFVTPTGPKSQVAAETLLTNAGASPSALTYGYAKGVINAVKFVTPSELSALATEDFASVWGTDFSATVSAPALNLSTLRTSLIALGVSALILFVYLWARLGWTYALTILATLTFDAFAVIAVFAFTRVGISPLFAALALATLSYNAYDKVVAMHWVRESLRAHTSKYDAPSIRRLVQEGIQSAASRTLFTSGLLLVMFVVLMAISAPLPLEHGLLMLVTTIFTAASSLFTAPLVLTWLQIWKHRGIAWREAHNFWQAAKLEEQVIQGINDFRH